jgi:hypothetical protein
MIAPLTAGPLGYKEITSNANPSLIGQWSSLVPYHQESTYSVTGQLLVESKEVANNTETTPFSITFAGVTYNISRYNGSASDRGNVVGIKVETGVYFVSPIAIMYGNWNNTGGACNFGMFALDDSNNCVGVYYSSGGSTVSQGVFLGQIFTLTDFDGSIHNLAQGLTIDNRVIARLNSSYTYLICGAFSQFAGSNGFYTGFTIATTSDERIPTVSDSGSIIKMRPIACSALVTCTLPEINAGGNIVAYSAPSADIDNYYYKTSPQLGPFQEWENLARTNKGQLLHDGNFKDGCYVWSQPWDKNDTLMRTPTEVNDYAYQGIIVSGQLNPSVALTGVVNVGRIRICIVYEYTSDNRLFPGESCYGTTNDLDWVLSYLGSQQHATENGSHISSLKNIIKTGASFVTKSVPTVMKAVDTAGKVAGLLL